MVTARLRRAVRARALLRAALPVHDGDGGVTRGGARYRHALRAVNRRRGVPLTAPGGSPAAPDTGGDGHCNSVRWTLHWVLRGERRCPSLRPYAGTGAPRMVVLSLGNFARDPQLHAIVGVPSLEREVRRSQLGRAAPVALWGSLRPTWTISWADRSCCGCWACPSRSSSCSPFSGAERWMSPARTDLPTRRSMRVLSIRRGCGAGLVASGPTPAIAPPHSTSGRLSSVRTCSAGWHSISRATPSPASACFSIRWAWHPPSIRFGAHIAMAFHLVLIQAGIVRIRIDLVRHMPADDASAGSSIHHAMSELRRRFDPLRQAMILAAS